MQFGLLTYCIYFGDLYRLVNGYDNCGNVCGRNNSFETVSGCTSSDMTNLEYLIEPTAPGHSRRECADQCPDDRLVFFIRVFNSWLQHRLKWNSMPCMCA